MHLEEEVLDSSGVYVEREEYSEMSVDSRSDYAIIPSFLKGAGEMQTGVSLTLAIVVLGAWYLGRKRYHASKE